MKNPTIALTELAELHLYSYLQTAYQDKDADRLGLRVAAIASGCGGYEYSLKVAREPKPDDAIVQQGRVRLYVDPHSVPILTGVAIDYIEGLVQSGFKFINPNAPTGCAACSSSHSGSCGAS